MKIRFLVAALASSLIACAGETDEPEQKEGVQPRDENAAKDDADQQNTTADQKDGNKVQEMVTNTCESADGTTYEAPCCAWYCW